MAGPAPAAADAPLDDAAFAARLDPLGPFEPCPHLAVAVSGGADSTALALLAARWVGRRGGQLLALIVDHGLRPESAAEATAAAASLAAFGIASRILRWPGPHPGSALQQRARDARYRLLEDACATAGILHLLVAHHRDDQAETVAMRQARGSGRSGLAGMAAIRETRSVRILRPLLDVPHRCLVATAAAAGARWIEDPSNAAPRFERARLRAGEPLDSEALVGLAAACGAERAAAGRALADLLAERLQPHPAGFLRLRTDGLGDRLPAALSACLSCIGGTGLPQPREAVLRLCGMLARPGAAATLGGCLVRRSATGLTILREPRAAEGPRRLSPDETIHWDRRFRIRLATDVGGVEVAPLAAGERLLAPGERVQLAALPAAVRATLPAIRQEGRLLWVHRIGQIDAGSARQMNVFCTFEPVLPVLPAAFLPANVVSKPVPLIYRHR
ncbi:MAG: tRNA lysidine(34) synthetase TilS [Geminicoccaceae bacterium]